MEGGGGAGEPEASPYQTVQNTVRKRSVVLSRIGRTFWNARNAHVLRGLLTGFLWQSMTSGNKTCVATSRKTIRCKTTKLRWQRAKNHTAYHFYGKRFLRAPTSTIIQKNTRFTFSSMIKNLKEKDACASITRSVNLWFKHYLNCSPSLDITGSIMSTSYCQNILSQLLTKVGVRCWLTRSLNPHNAQWDTWKRWKVLDKCPSWLPLFMFVKQAPDLPCESDSSEGGEND